MYSLRKSTTTDRAPHSLWRVLSIVGGILLVIVLTACGGASSTPAPTPGPLQFTSINLKLPPAAYNAPTVGPLAATTILQLGVTFKVNPNALPTAGNGTQIPSGKDTDLSKYANEYGITDATYQKIEQYLGVDGVTLNLGKLHSYMTIKAQASTVEKLFQTQFVNHKLNNRTYYIPTTTPKLPTFVMQFVVAVTGLETYSMLAPGASLAQSSQAQDSRMLTSSVPVGNHLPAANCSPKGGVFPQDIAGSYGYTAFWKQKYLGQHMTINLIELGGTINSDLQNYFSCVGFPASQMQFVNVDTPPTQPSDEATLDIDMIAGLAPGATIVDYQSGDQTFGALLDELQAIIDANAKHSSPGSIVSISYGGPEDGLSQNAITAFEQAMQTLVHTEHMTVFVASGDCGAYVGGDATHLDVSYPATSPWATAVGGTELGVTGQGTRSNEIVWGAHPAQSPCNNQWGSGGGLSTIFKRPDWQIGTGVNNNYSDGARQVPDISAIAYDLPIFFEGQWAEMVGTSAATPIWASGMALVEQVIIARKQSFVYSSAVFYLVQNHDPNARSFFDIVQGDNQYYKATPYWDYTTGWGTPNLVNFYNAVLSVFYS